MTGFNSRPLNEAERRRLATARARLLLARPYLAPAIHRMRPKAVPGLGTFAVDPGWGLYVDPRVLFEWSLTEVAAVLEHEAGHLLRDHAGRAPALANETSCALRWNVACDIAINDNLEIDNLPGTPVIPQSFNVEPHLTEEFYFQRLRDVGKLADCGSGVDGVPREWDVDDPDRVDVVEAQIIRDRVAGLHRTYGPGSSSPIGRRAGPGTRQLRVPGAVDVYKQVAGLLRRTHLGAPYSTWNRPSRRPKPAPFLAPGCRRLSVPVAIVVDTSGSMDHGRLGLAVSATRIISRDLGADTVDLWICDTSASRACPTGDAWISELRTGGGTDMRVGIEAARKAMRGPGLVVVITDGETPWPEQPVPDVVIVLVDPEPHPATPDWARTIRLAPDAR